MSFYTGIYGGGLYSGVHSSKYGGSAIRQKNTLGSVTNPNNLQQTVSPKRKKARMGNDGNYALATISLMAISLFTGYKMKGGLKGIGTAIGNAASGIGNLAKGGFTKIKTGAGNLLNKAMNIFRKP